MCQGVTGSDMGEAHQGTHQGQFSRMIQLEAGNALAIGEHGRLAKTAQFAAIEEGLLNVLLYLLMAGGYALQFFAEGDQVFHCHSYTVVLWLHLSYRE